MFSKFSYVLVFAVCVSVNTIAFCSALCKHYFALFLSIYKRPRQDSNLHVVNKFRVFPLNYRGQDPRLCTSFSRLTLTFNAQADIGRG